jgi:hypothetical protein
MDRNFSQSGGIVMVSDVPGASQSDRASRAMSVGARPRAGDRDWSGGRRIGAEGDLELVAESQVFERDIATRSETADETANQEADERKHPAGTATRPRAKPAD